MASMTDPSETMYLRIKKVMESYGLQQQAFAKKLGVSPATISSIYTGRTKPSNNLVQAIQARCACCRRLFLLLLNRKSLCKMSFLTKRSLLLLSPLWEARCLCSLLKRPHKWRRLLSRYNPSPLVLPLHTVLQTEPLRSRLSRCFILMRIILTNSLVELRKFVCFMTTVLSKFLRRRTNECTHCQEVRSLSGYET